jgi:hypothetical protein
MVSRRKVKQEVSRMNMPGFTAEAALNKRREYQGITTLLPRNQRVIAQSKMTCAFKAGRLAGRCLALGFDHFDCMEAAADFNEFCNEHDL